MSHVSVCVCVCVCVCVQMNFKCTVLTFYKPVSYLIHIV